MKAGNSFYDKAYYEGNQQDRDRPALRLYQRLARRYLPQGPILDFGCGVGHLLRRLAKDRPVIGVESSPWAAAKSRHRVPEARMLESLEECPDGSCSAIVSIHVVEHIDDMSLERVLAHFRRILKPGGRALIVTPDATGWAARVKGERWLALTDPTHINLKGHAEWRALFVSAGFRLVEEAADGLFDFPYPPRSSALLDVGLRGWPTLLQFLAGRLLLRPSSGESSIFVFELECPRPHALGQRTTN